MRIISLLMAGEFASFWRSFFQLSIWAVGGEGSGSALAAAEADDQLPDFLPGKSEKGGQKGRDEDGAAGVEDAGQEEAGEALHAAQTRKETGFTTGEGQRQQGGEAPDLMEQVAPEAQRHKAGGQPEIEVDRQHLHEYCFAG